MARVDDAEDHRVRRRGLYDAAALEDGLEAKVEAARFAEVLVEQLHLAARDARGALGPVRLLGGRREAATRQVARPRPTRKRPVLELVERAVLGGLGGLLCLGEWIAVEVAPDGRCMAVEGQWKAVEGQWKAVEGQWKAVEGQWKVSGRTRQK